MLQLFFLGFLLPSLLSGAPNRATSIWTVYKNGIIYSVDTNLTDWSTNFYKSIGIQDGAIKCIGTNEEVENCIPKDDNKNVIDLQDKFTILPGFHDVHQHPLEASNNVGGLCKMRGDQLPNSEITRKALVECSGKITTSTKWYLGFGHSIDKILEYLSDPSNPDPKTLLDNLFFDAKRNPAPALMLEATSHSAWVNSAALAELGITSKTENPTGGIILKNKAGEPNGILLENAGNMALDEAFNITKYPELAGNARNAVRNALLELNKNGITSIVEARSFWRRQDDKAWEAVNENNELTVRAILALWAYPELDDAYQIAQLKARHSNKPGSLLRKSNIKLYSDGLLGALTAALLKPYNKNNNYGAGVIPLNRGIHYFDQTRLTKYMQQLQTWDNKEGFDFTVHTIGDEAVRQGLDSVQNSKREDYAARHRLTHIELIDESDVPRFKSIGVIADPQLSGNWTLPTSETHKELPNLIGPDRAERSIPVKDLLTNGTLITLSSDWDVNDLNPFLGLQHALQRGKQSISLKAAIEMYTINSAFAMRQEKVTGSLVKGKEADLIVIDKDIFKISPEQIGTTVVQQTLLKGKEVFRLATFKPSNHKIYF